jgi:glycosyltransferase involved in cell wall biosynthesis
LLVVDSLEVGGAERHVADLALALAHRGHGVEMACSVNGALSEPLEEAGLPVRLLAPRLVKRRVELSYARGLWRLVAGRGFDLVHAHVYASAVAAAIATAGTGTPLVITEHTEALWQGRRARAISGWASRRARRMIAVTSVIRERLLERDGVPPERITVIPNAIVPDERSCAPSGLPAGLRGGPVVGIIARLQPEKGVADFVRAAARVARSVPAARFAIVGDGPLRGELSALAGQLGVDDRVHFLGIRSDVRGLMDLMDVIVVPSLSEGAPLVTLEAMAAGLPVVASRVGGIPDQIRHNREGLLVPPGDPTSLGAALIELLRDPQRTISLGEAGRLRAILEFGHGTMVSRVENVYRAALGLKLTEEVASEQPGLQRAG